MKKRKTKRGKNGWNGEQKDWCKDRRTGKTQGKMAAL